MQLETGMDRIRTFELFWPRDARVILHAWMQREWMNDYDLECPFKNMLERTSKCPKNRSGFGSANKFPVFGQPQKLDA